jgi:hypothetical protein
MTPALRATVLIVDDDDLRAARAELSDGPIETDGGNAVSP